MATSTAAPATGVADVGVLAEVTRARARAEAAETLAMMAHRDHEWARTASVESAIRRQVERAAVTLTIAEALRLSEQQVRLWLWAADTVHQHTPTVWAAFTDGRIDLARVREIARTVDRLHRPESVTRLDDRVVAYAETHTVAELRGWLRRFVQRVEADLATERAEVERARRRVTIHHGDDGMSWLEAYLPSHDAAAIAARLYAHTRHTTRAEGDDRTVDQRDADHLVELCTRDIDGAGTAASAHIAVLVDADTLAGAVPGFAESTDGRWAVPATWLDHLITTGNPFWHRILRDPITRDVLSHEYLGRFAPHVLATALRFRDGTCRAPGCMVPAEHCDLDHHVPHPDGPTRADNLGPLCRRHHRYKSHGHLHWSTRQPDPPAPLVIELCRDPLAVEYVTAA